MTHLDAGDLQETLDQMIEDVVKWTGSEQSDDYTIIAMQVAEED